jgi:hypothetical protein
MDPQGQQAIILQISNHTDAQQPKQPHASSASPTDPQTSNPAPLQGFNISVKPKDPKASMQAVELQISMKPPDVSGPPDPQVSGSAASQQFELLNAYTPVGSEPSPSRTRVYVQVRSGQS